MQGDEENPKIPMGDNCRPPQRVNDRTVATNINFANPVSIRILVGLHGFNVLTVITPQFSVIMIRNNDDTVIERCLRMT